MKRRWPLFLALWLSSCATTDPGAPTYPGALNLVWPAAPEPARIEFVTSFSTADDLGLRDTFSRRLKKLLAGGDDRHMSRPYAVALSPSTVAIADPGGATVHIYNTAKSTYRKLDRAGKTPFRSPIGVAFAGDQLVIADSELKKVFLLDRRFKLLRSLGGFLRPTSLAFDPAGKRLYIADTLAHEVQVFGLDGSLLYKIGIRGEQIGQFNFPSHLAFAGDRLLVNDTMNFRIQIFSAEGDHMGSFGKHGDGSGYFAQAKGVAMDSDGHVYVADALANRVQIFDQSGRFLLGFGSSGNGPGDFQIPSGLAILDDMIYVADSYNQRIQVFRYLPGAK